MSVKKYISLLAVLLIAFTLIYINTNTSREFSFNISAENLLNITQHEGIYVEINSECNETSLTEKGTWLIHNNGSDLKAGNIRGCKGVIYDTINSRTSYICSNDDSVDILYLLNEVSLYEEKKEEYNTIKPAYYSDNSNRFNIFVSLFFNDKGKIVARSETILSLHLEKTDEHFNNNLVDVWTLAQYSNLEVFEGNIKEFDIIIEPLDDSYSLHSYSPTQAKITGKYDHEILYDDMVNKLSFNIEDFYLFNDSDLANDKLHWEIRKKMLQNDSTVSYNNLALIMVPTSKLHLLYEVNVRGLGLDNEAISIMVDL